MNSELGSGPARLLAVATILLSSACTYDENLPNADLFGTVVIPKELTSVRIVDIDNEEWVVEDDIRAIGPVYIGVYAGIDETLYSYPHPEWGPLLGDNEQGDAYPYGGTSSGRFAWGCYQATVCKTVSGRYESYQQVLDFFRDELRAPLLDDHGDEVTTAEQYQERCFEIEYVTSDDELDIVGPIDFRDEGDNWVADVSILRSQFKEGMHIWGFADMPSQAFGFSTCDPSTGSYHSNYDEQYYTGTNYRDVLNFPGKYISDGDLVSEVSVEVTDAEAEFELTLGYKHED